MKHFTIIILGFLFISCTIQDNFPTIINCSASERTNDSVATIFIITKGDFFRDTAWRAFIPDIIKSETVKDVYSSKAYFFFWVMSEDEFTLPIKNCEDFLKDNGIFKPALSMFYYDYNSKELMEMVDSTGNQIFSNPNIKDR